MIDLNVNEYVKPDSLRVAYDVLISDSKNQIIGGGAWIKMASNKEINTLIDLSNLNLNKITSTDLEFKIGAYVSLHELERFEELNKYYDGIIRQAIKEIMGVGIRNLATVGGSIMGKFSFSDLYGVLIAVDASLEFYQQGIISVREFLENKRFDKDILLHVIIPKKKAKGFFKKVKTTALDFAILNVCVVKDGRFEIVIGARPGIATRAVRTSEFLDGKDIDDKVIEEALDILEEEIKFSKNAKASKEYRSDLALVYVKRGIKEVIK